MFSSSVLGHFPAVNDSQFRTFEGGESNDVIVRSVTKLLKLFWYELCIDWERLIRGRPNPEFHWLRLIATTLRKFHWWILIFLDAKAKKLICEFKAQNLKQVSLTKSF